MPRLSTKEAKKTSAERKVLSRHQTFSNIYLENMCDSDILGAISVELE